MHKTRPLLARQVDLRDVAGDDDPGAEAEPGQEHLHLLRRGVLRLVEDDEAVVESPTPHVCERRDLDRAALHVGVQPLRIHRVVERVEERAHVRVDLRRDVARQEPEPLAGLDGRAREDDAADLTLGQGGDRECDREIRLARSGGADPERQRRAPDRVDVVLLRHRLRRDPLAAMRPDDVFEDVADILRLVDRVQNRVDRPGADLLPALDELDELLDDGPRLRDLDVVAVQRQPVAAQVDRAAEPVAERVEDAVRHPRELGGNLVRNLENVLHGVSVGALPPDAARA